MHESARARARVARASRVRRRGFSRGGAASRLARLAITLKRSSTAETHLSVVTFCWKDVWHEHNTQKLVDGDNTVALVSSLKPATTYHFRVLAENHLGTSAPSDILHVSIKHCRKSKQKKKKKKIAWIERKLSHYHEAIFTSSFFSADNVQADLFLFSRAPWVRLEIFETGANGRRSARWTAQARFRGAPGSAAAQDHVATAGSIPVERRTARIHHQLHQSRVSLSALPLLSHASLRHLASIIGAEVSNNDHDDRLAG